MGETLLWHELTAFQPMSGPPPPPYTAHPAYTQPPPAYSYPTYAQPHPTQPRPTQPPPAPHPAYAQPFPPSHAHVHQGGTIAPAPGGWVARPQISAATASRSGRPCEKCGMPGWASGNMSWACEHCKHFNRTGSQGVVCAVM